MLKHLGLGARKLAFRGLRTTKVQLDQHICFSHIESSVSKLATGEIEIFLLIFQAETTGLTVALSETPETGFVG